MGHSIFFSLHARLRPATPAPVIEWLEARTAGRDVAPGFAVPEPAGGLVDDVAWLLGLPGAAGLAVAGADGWHLHVQARLSDDAQGAVYGTPFLVAPYCPDGMVATAWTDMEDVAPTLFLVQGGVPFVGDTRRPPVAAVESEQPAPIWRLGHEGLGREPVDAAELERYGAPDPPRLAAEGAESAEPVFARYLFGRSVLRALDALAAGGDDRVPARDDLERGARAVLELLDAGCDPTAAPDTPGWTLQEVQRSDRLWSGPPAPSGRALGHVAATLDDLRSAAHGAGPHPLRPGARVRSLPGLRLAATGPLTTYDDPDTGRPAGTSHILDLEPPPGTLLETTRVHGFGGAECVPIGTDWATWIVPRPGPPVSPLPDHLLYDAGRYTLGFLRPDDEGRLFTLE